MELLHIVMVLIRFLLSRAAAVPVLNLLRTKKKKKITRRIPTIGILFFKNSMAVVVTQKTVFDGKTLDGDDWRPVKIFLSSVARLNVIDLFSNIQQINYAIQVQIHVQRCR